MPITWPSGTNLPQKPQKQGFSEDPGDTSIETPTQIGPPKKRNQSTFPIATLKCRFLLVSATQRSNLLTFWATTTASGTTEFEWVHPITGTTYNWTMSKPVITPAGSVSYWADIVFTKVS